MSDFFKSHHLKKKKHILHNMEYYTIWNNYMLRELFFNNDRSIIFTIVFPKIGFHINITTSNTIWNILSIHIFS